MLIIAKMVATYYSYPYRYRYTQTFVCGGTLINRYTILTAAHCISTSFKYGTTTLYVDNPFDSTQYTVYVGLNNDSFIDTGVPPPYPAVAMSVNNIIRVS